MTDPEIRSFHKGKTSFEYLYYQGPEQVLIMMHATGFLPWLWHPIARELTDRFTVIAPFFCEHDSPEPDNGGLPWKIIADDLCVMCEEMKITSPFLIGHSMGGTVMTIAASTGLPGTRGLILIEPIYLPEEWYGAKITVEQHPLASKSIKRKNFWSGREEAREYLLGRGLFRNWDSEMLELYIKYGMKPENGGLSLACHPKREAALFMGGNHCNPWPLLEKISCPVLFLEGETSGNRSYIDLKKAASMIPHGSYRLIPGAGHLIPMEKPLVILEIIRDFFES